MLKLDLLKKGVSVFGKKFSLKNRRALTRANEFNVLDSIISTTEQRLLHHTKSQFLSEQSNRLLEFSLIMSFSGHKYNYFSFSEKSH